MIQANDARGRRALLPVLLATTALALPAASPALAADVFWHGTVSGDWFDGANWTGSVPTASDDARIDASGSPPTISGPGAVTHHLTVNGTLSVTGTSGALATLDGNIGSAAGSVGTVTVEDGAEWTASLGIYVGNYDRGTLRIETGGSVTGRYGFVGNHTSGGTSAVGTATVSGAGSSLTFGENLFVGNQGQGTLTIADGGTVNVGDTVSIAHDSGSTGTLNIGAAEGDAAVAPGTLDASTVQFGDGTGMLVFNHTSVGGYAFGADISGDGTIKQLAGETNLSGDSSGFTGFTDVSGGRLVLTGQLGGTGQVDTDGTANVIGGDALWSMSDNFTVGFSGTGTLTVAAGGEVDNLIGYIGLHSGSIGTVRVLGDGSIWNNDGNLVVGGSGTATLTVADGGVVSAANPVKAAFDSGSTGTINIGAAAGDAAVAPGTLDAPTVQFGDGTGKLVFNHTSGSYTFAPRVFGNGEIDQVAGTTILTGDSSGFGGTTDVSGGTLIVNGRLGRTLNVLPGGELKGSGTVGTVAITGTVSPGNSPGTLHVADATFSPGSTYLVELNDGGNTAGTNNDLVDASGTVTVNGGTVHVTPENGTDDGSTYAPGTTYTIVRAAGGVTGTFDTLTDDYAFLNFALSYDVNDIFLTSSLAALCRAGFTANECATADAVGSLGSGALLTAVAGLGTAEAAGAMDSLSGEIHASAKSALIDDSRFPREAIENRLRQAFGGVDAGGKGIDEKRVSETASVWAQGFGSWGHWDGDGNAARLDRSIGGLFIGGDASVTDNLRLGIMGGYSRSSFDVDSRSSSGSSVNYTLGAYGAGQWNALGLRFGTTYSWHDLSTSRSVAFTGFSDDLSADYNAGTFQSFGEAGYRFDYGRAHFEPFAGLAYVHLNTDGFAETGGAAALKAAGQTMDATFTTLGLRAGTDVALSDALTAHLSGGVGWRHSFGDVTPDATLAFASGGDAYMVAGVPIARNALVFDAGFDVPLAANAKLGLAYDGQVGSGMLDQSVKADLTVRF